MLGTTASHAPSHPARASAEGPNEPPTWSPPCAPARPPSSILHTDPRGPGHVAALLTTLQPLPTATGMKPGCAPPLRSPPEPNLRPSRPHSRSSGPAQLAAASGFSLCGWFPSRGLPGGLPPIPAESWGFLGLHSPTPLPYFSQSLQGILFWCKSAGDSLSCLQLRNPGQFHAGLHEANGEVGHGSAT